MGWNELFERAAGFDVSEAGITAALARCRDGGQSEDEDENGDEDEDRNAGNDEDGNRDEGEDGNGDEEGGQGTSEPMARVVADADVLAADLLVGGPAREAIDVVRAHSWVTLVASEALLSDAEAVIADLSDPSLAGDWRSTVEELAEVVEHPAGDHPAIAAAYRGEARHVLSLSEQMLSAAAGVAVRARVETSVKHPGAFARLFDPEAVYPIVVGGTYPGPDRDLRE